MVGMVCLDMEETFYVVWRIRLIDKLSKIGIKKCYHQSGKLIPLTRKPLRKNQEYKKQEMLTYR